MEGCRNKKASRSPETVIPPSLNRVCNLILSWPRKSGGFDDAATLEGRKFVAEIYYGLGHIGDLWYKQRVGSLFRTETSAFVTR